MSEVDKWYIRMEKEFKDKFAHEVEMMEIQIWWGTRSDVALRLRRLELSGKVSKHREERLREMIYGEDIASFKLAATIVDALESENLTLPDE